LRAQSRLSEPSSSGDRVCIYDKLVVVVIVLIIIVIIIIVVIVIVSLARLLALSDFRKLGCLADRSQPNAHLLPT
jgi:hypothetical protein